MTSFEILLTVVGCLLPLLWSWWYIRRRREVTIFMKSESTIGFDPGTVVTVDSKPLTVLKVDREKGEVTLG